MVGLPLFTQHAVFTGTGYADVTLADIPLPLQRIPSKWSLQVSGLAADGKTNVAATSWNVTLQGGGDGIGYDGDSQAILTHASVTNPDGSTVRTTSPVGPARRVRIHCQALSLGATCTQIVVSVVGV